MNKMETLKLISWNINGLNSARKRQHVKQKCNIICLQEAHIKKTDCKYIVNKRLGEEYYS